MASEGAPRDWSGEPDREVIDSVHPCPRPTLAALEFSLPTYPGSDERLHSDWGFDSSPRPRLRAWASKNHRSRIWQAPISAADTIVHRQSYPSAVNSKRIRSSPRRVIAGTFSKKMYLGRISRVRRMISKNNPDRLPSKPAPVPARLISWHGHGNPAVMISMPDSF